MTIRQMGSTGNLDILSGLTPPSSAPGLGSEQEIIEKHKSLTFQPLNADQLDNVPNGSLFLTSSDGELKKKSLLGIIEDLAGPPGPQGLPGVGGGSSTFTYPKGSLTELDIGKFLMEDGGVAAVYAEDSAEPGVPNTWTFEFTEMPTEQGSTVSLQTNMGNFIYTYGVDWQVGGDLNEVATNLSTAITNLQPQVMDQFGGMISYNSSALGNVVTVASEVGYLNIMGGVSPSINGSFCNILETKVGSASIPQGPRKMFLGKLLGIDGDNALISNYPVLEGIAQGTITRRWQPGAGEVSISVVDGTHIKQYTGIGDIPHGYSLVNKNDGETVLFRVG